MLGDQRRSGGEFPFLITRTPYGTGPYGENSYRSSLGPSRHSLDFEKEGFIFVFQDVRGKFRSEGKFVVMRPHNTRKTGKETDESSDLYDTIEWLLANIPNHNGRVGQIGTSYPGFQVVMGMIDAATTLLPLGEPRILLVDEAPRMHPHDPEEILHAR